MTTAADISYDVERAILHGAATPALLLSFLFSVLVLAKIWQKHRGGAPTKHPKLTAVITILVLPAALLVVFMPAMLSLSGVIERATGLAFFVAEAKSGALALRIASLLIAWGFFSTAYRAYIAKRDSDQAETKPALYSTHYYLCLASVLQYLFYAACASALWICTVEGVSSFTQATISWLLIFILDDWSIVSDYSIKYSEPPMAWHFWKVHITNAVLLLTLAYVVLQSLSIGSATLILLPTAFSIVALAGAIRKVRRS